MTTRIYLTGSLLALVLAGCTGGAGTPGGTNGAERLNGVQARFSNVPWGDGRRTTAFNNAVFNYFPVLPAQPTATTVRDMTITSTGEVTVRFTADGKEPAKGTLTAEERQTFSRLSQAVTFEYRTCPIVAAADQPRFTWQFLGSNHEFRPACPGNPNGLTSVLAPETAEALAGFVASVIQRLTA
jgi:hypothetical protein